MVLSADLPAFLYNLYISLGTLLFINKEIKKMYFINTSPLYSTQIKCYTWAWYRFRVLALCRGIRTLIKNCLCSVFRGNANPLIMLKEIANTVTVIITQNWYSGSNNYYYLVSFENTINISFLYPIMINRSWYNMHFHELQKALFNWHQTL